MRLSKKINFKNLLNFLLKFYNIIVMGAKTTKFQGNEDLIVWEERFAIGIPIVDSEHKRLVEMCNELYKAIVSGKADERKTFVFNTLKECVDYVKTHFAHEEKLMQVCGYKDFDMHKKEHVEFTKKVLEKCRNFEKENYYSSMQFVKFLYGWILSHIAHTDRLFVDDLKVYLKNKK